MYFIFQSYEYKLLELETKIEDLKSAHVNNMEQLENSLQAQGICISSV